MEQGHRAGRARGTAVFPPPRDFSSLSVKDLLEAREHYHVHLSNIETVVATAIGRYRIHEDDYYATHPPGGEPPPEERGKKRVRTLENSVVRPWSWPCVMVFVNKWGTQDDAPKGRRKPERKPRIERVPSRLHLPDGRIVPTCVLYAKPDEELPPPIDRVRYASHLVGGGYGCSRTAQGIERFGTIGCLVERNGSYYALTNRHVVGRDDGVVETSINEQRIALGKTDPHGADRVAFRSIFPEWPGERALINIDAGLIEVADIKHWTSQVFGIGEIGEPFNATPSSLTLDIIGVPVRAFGAVSGVLDGEIQALFVRYKSLNGFDYVSDLLIGRRKRAESSRGVDTYIDTRPGDSGTLWFYDPPNNPPKDTPHDPNLLPPEAPPERGERARRLRPIAMQWGGQRVLDENDEPVAHALATFVSTVCRVLDVDLVRGYGTGHDEYWGKYGHFSIGWKACDRIDKGKLPKLYKLMKANQARIGFDDQRLGEGRKFSVGDGKFVPLADVPDYVKWFGGQHEDQQHFADIDCPAIDGSAPLFDRCLAQPKTYISASQWKAYFDAFKANDVGPEEGTLPLRVWQLWEEMKRYAGKNAHVIRFVTVGGILAHYVGDASQPMHASILHHGKGPGKKKINGYWYPYRHIEDREHPEYKKYRAKPEYEVHAAYETDMFEVDTPDLLADFTAKLKKRAKPKADITSGWQAAHETLKVMDAARQRLPPATIIKYDDPSLGPTARKQHLAAKPVIREATLESLVDSAQLLARLWASAWFEGGGEARAGSVIRAYTEGELVAIYGDKSKLEPCLDLAGMVKKGTFEPPP